MSMKKRIALCVIAAVVVLAAAIYIFFYFNGIAVAVWKLKFSYSDVVTRFDVKDVDHGAEIVLVNSRTRLAILNLNRDVAGFYHNVPLRDLPHNDTLETILKSDKKRRFAVNYYTENRPAHNVFGFKMVAHFLIAGTSRKIWHLEKLGSPKDGSFKLQITCFAVSGGQVFLADATSSNGMNSGKIEQYIEQYEKTQSAR